MMVRRLGEPRHAADTGVSSTWRRLAASRQTPSQWPRGSRRGQRRGPAVAVRSGRHRLSASDLCDDASKGLDTQDEQAN